MTITVPTSVGAPLKWLCAYRWSIGIRRRNPAFRPEEDPSEFTFLDTPLGHFHADPFIVEDQGRLFLFFEDYNYITRRGKLACSELDTSLKVIETRTILERPHHLSYPHVFELDGSFYMIPETASVNRVELHRAARFPWEWKLEKVLLAGAPLQDVTFLEFDGLHWLFAGGSSNGARGQYDELHVFHTSNIFDGLIAHPGNPVKTDIGTARPAGAIIRHGDRLIRPSQDCSRWYGCGLNFMEIDVMGKADYAERPLFNAPDLWQGSGNCGTHTYNASANFEVIDVCCYGLEPAAWLGRARSLCRKVMGAERRRQTELAAAFAAQS